MKLFFKIVFTSVIILNGLTVRGEVMPTKSDSDSIHYFSQRYVGSDSIHFLRQNGILIPVNNYIPLNNNLTFQDTIFYNPVFLPVVFDGQLLPDNLNFYDDNTISHANSYPVYHLISPDSTLLPQLKQINWIKEVRRNYYINDPSVVRYNIFAMKQLKEIKEQKTVNPAIYSGSIRGKIEDYKTKIDIAKYVPKQIYWTKSGEHSLQLNQNQYSNNWYGSGNNNLNVVNYQKILLNYKKDKLSWNNTLEWKLNFQRVPADSIHRLSVNEDYIRVYSVAGIDAYKNWSYSVKNEIKTPIFTNYSINSTKRKAAFLSPLQINSGIGMTYSLTKSSKLNKYRKTTLSLDLSPLSVNYVYVGDSKVDETNYSVAEGQKSKLTLGSTYTMNLTYTHNRNSTFTSRLKYFTSYSSIIVESENKLNFAFNRLLTSTLYLYMRYDDTVSPSKKDPNLGYFQYYELVGFGLSYTW